MPSELFKTDVGITSKGYKVILSYESYNNATFESVTKYAELDVQDSGLDVKSDVELTSHPTLNHQNISDHIYRLPIIINVKGEFADNGLKSQGWIGEDRLTRIQSEFEACQRAGVKFNVVTIRDGGVDDKSNWRFLVRRNMVLTSIAWTQNQHTLGFSFSFKEALSSNLHIVDTKVDLTDPNLPAITDLSAASLVGEVISSNNVIEMTIEVLQSLNLVNDATFWACQATAVASLGLGVTIAAVASQVLIAIASVTGHIPVVGWIVAAACVVVAGICAVFSWIAAAKREEQLEHYRKLGHVFLIEDNMTDNEKHEIVRNFIKFLSEVKMAVDDGLRDVSVFRIAKADRQECALTVNGSYYVQRIEKNDDDLSYRIESRFMGQQVVKTLPKIVALESFADCSDSPSSVYFYDEYGIAGSTYRVYIINRSAYKQEMMNEPTTEDKLNGLSGNYLSDQEKYVAEKEQLLDFAFVVSPYPLTDLTDKIGNIITNIVG